MNGRHVFKMCKPIQLEDSKVKAGAALAVLMLSPNTWSTYATNMVDLWQLMMSTLRGLI